MKRTILMLVGVAALLGVAGQAKADVITVNFPEFNGPTEYSGFPLPALTVGTQTYSVPAGQTVTAADLSGTFGSTSQFYGSSAEFDLLLNGVQIGSTYDVTPDPYYNVVPFDFTITSPTVLSSLSSGSATLSVVQESNYNIRLSSTTLTISTPEPSGFALLGLGVICLAAGYVARKKTLAPTAA